MQHYFLETLYYVFYNFSVNESDKFYAAINGSCFHFLEAFYIDNKFQPIAKEYTGTLLYYKC